MTPPPVESIAIDVDIVVIAFVLMSLAVGVFMAIWGVSRSSASREDVSALAARVDAVDRKADETSSKLAELERAISHLPTDDDVHKIDLRLERVTTVVESISRQTERIHDHLMDVAQTRAAEAETKETRE